MSLKIYTSTPLITKLGILAGMKIYAINPPESYPQMLGKLPEDVEIFTKTEKKVDFIHIFLDENFNLSQSIQDALNHIYSMGVIWISWPRKADSPSLNESHIKKTAYQYGLKDEKFTLLDDYWCGLLLRPIKKY